METEILEKLTTLAEDRTVPFFMRCYIKAPKGTCPSCNSEETVVG